MPQLFEILLLTQSAQFKVQYIKTAKLNRNTVAFYCQVSQAGTTFPTFVFHIDEYRRLQVRNGHKWNLHIS